ncbi:chlorohydrolase family protein [Bordetella sp. BOR01]|uniref:chlorohydrolase family protein n=1 Tax=Bordetella sp. BOR01 TaxID=2854779 RepID=UPI001C4768FE|nr:chlorohydrolase family protein [Bordetella sp. BOR01]MBV7481432.1 amidohydrolase family protein [Bordetella sp. BOR01]
MRTRIDGGWVVGFKDGGHEVLRNACVVYEGERIVYVGHDYPEPVDQIIDASSSLVSPGFIDTHVHSGHRALHKLLADTGRPDLFGQPYMDVTIPRAGTKIQGYPNYLARDEAAADPGIALHAAFTISELLRNGVTTFVELGGHVVVQEALWKQCESLGVRGYLGPGYDSGRWASDQDGNLTREPYQDGGLHLFNDAVDFIQRVKLHGNDLVHGILVPREVENCSVDILRRTVAAARELGVPMATHAGYNVIEFYETVRQHRKTPIELLDSVDMLTPSLNIGHANLISDSPRLNYSGGRDLQRMGGNRVSVSHCPINIVRRARVLDSWKKYREAGINMTIGSDTYPRDMVMNMRTASYHGKVMSHDLTAASAEEVFEAATLGGARSLDRADIGRLAPGARADIIAIDLARKDVLRYGPIWDPIRSLVECGVGDDVSLVITNGVVRMRDSVIPDTDLGALRASAQAFAENVWGKLQEWDPLKRTARAMCRPSFCPDCD